MARSHLLRAAESSAIGRAKRRDRRMSRIAMQSAVGGRAVCMLGILLAAAGYLPPVAGAVAQEAIDIATVLNALRVYFRVAN